MLKDLIKNLEKSDNERAYKIPNKKEESVFVILDDMRNPDPVKPFIQKAFDFMFDPPFMILPFSVLVIGAFITFCPCHNKHQLKEAVHVEAAHGSVGKRN